MASNEDKHNAHRYRLSVPRLVEIDYDSWKIRIHRLHSRHTPWQADMEISPEMALHLTYDMIIQLLIDAVALHVGMKLDSEFSEAEKQHLDGVYQQKSFSVKGRTYSTKEDVNDMKIIRSTYPLHQMNTMFVKTFRLLGMYVTNVKPEHGISPHIYGQILTHLNSLSSSAKKTLKKQEQSTSIVIHWLCSTHIAPALSSPSTPISTHQNQLRILQSWTHDFGADGHIVMKTSSEEGSRLMLECTAPYDNLRPPDYNKHVFKPIRGAYASEVDEGPKAAVAFMATCITGAIQQIQSMKDYLEIRRNWAFCQTKLPSQVVVKSATPATPFVRKSRPPSQVLTSLRKVNVVFPQFEDQANSESEKVLHFSNILISNKQLQGTSDTIRNWMSRSTSWKVLISDFTSLRIQLDGLKVENVSLKRRYDELSRANNHSRTVYTEKLSAFTAENTKLKAQVTGVQIVLWYWIQDAHDHMTGDVAVLNQLCRKDQAHPILGRTSFVDGGLEVAFSTAFMSIRNTDMVDYSKVHGNQSVYLTADMMSASPSEELPMQEYAKTFESSLSAQVTFGLVDFLRSKEENPQVIEERKVYCDRLTSPLMQLLLRHDTDNGTELVLCIRHRGWFESVELHVLWAEAVATACHYSFNRIFVHTVPGKPSYELLMARKNLIYILRCLVSVYHTNDYDALVPLLTNDFCANSTELELTAFSQEAKPFCLLKDQTPPSVPLKIQQLKAFLAHGLCLLWSVETLQSNPSPSFASLHLNLTIEGLRVV
ncbi:hypothetical protein Tco_1152683 [Tanacetum coccineum]